MKNLLKVIGIIALAAIIGFGMVSCTDPASNLGGDDPNDKNEPDINTAFTISGSFATQNDGATDATFYAKSTVTPSASWSRSASRAAGELVEVSLEGLLEDGDITFKLKGSYNSETKLYMLSAASSFLRYSIAGDITDKNSSEAVVQVKEGNSWTSIKISVKASIDGTPPSIDGSGTIADELANGIPEDMWGAWWGLETLEKGKGDIIQPGDYYYMLDAYTIKQYVNRYDLWNLEGYTCFFEGATKEGDIAKGRVEFNYTNQAAIDASTDDKIKNWWINHLIAYAKANYNSVHGGNHGDGDRLAEVKDDDNQGWNLWGDPSWTLVLDRYKAPAQADEGPLGTNQVWNSHFGPGTEFSYTAYRNDAYRIQNNQLQFGRYYAANGTDYFSKDPAGITGYTTLKWGAFHSRDKNAALNAVKTREPVKETWGNLKIPAEVTAIKHNTFEQKENVLEVISGAHWSVLDYSVGSFYGKGVKFTAISMDVWIEKKALVVWQLNNVIDKDGNYGYPMMAGSWTALDAGKWYNITLENTNPYGIESHEAVLYLSTMQFLKDDSDGATVHTENTIYIANVTINAQEDTSIKVDVLDPIESNFGESQYGYERKDWAVWENFSGEGLALLKSSQTLEITFSKELTKDINFAWLEIGNNYAWRGGSLIYQGGPAAGVTLSPDKKKVTVDLGVFNISRGILMSQDVIVLVIEGIGVDSINELGIVSAMLSGTYVPPAEEVLGDYAAYYWWNGPYSSSVNFQIVNLNLEGKDNVMKVVNPREADPNVVQYDLGEYKNQNIKVTFSAKVKRVGSAGNLLWQINNSNYPSVGSQISNAAVDTWHSMSGEWTGTPTADHPSLYLSTYQNNSDITTYYIDDFSVTVEEVEPVESGIWQDLITESILGNNGGTLSVVGNKVVQTGRSENWHGIDVNVAELRTTYGEGAITFNLSFDPPLNYEKEGEEEIANYGASLAGSATTTSWNPGATASLTLADDDNGGGGGDFKIESGIRILVNRAKGTVHPSITITDIKVDGTSIINK